MPRQQTAWSMAPLSRVQLPKPGVVDVLAAEVTESCERVPLALFFMGLLEGWRAHHRQHVLRWYAAGA